MAGSLAGRTLFVTGASRGIGLNIALRAAADGANIVIAAKTTEPHPKLPGTIYTAAEEIENAGGKCLPCVVDIRHEDQVAAAVEQAVSKFGGIDILINNASAIHMTGTDSTPMKKYDLMNQVNTRGTFLCSKLALPHLRKGTNPHILNISPPLNMTAKWFKNHAAYTIAKYGMSMCVLGMAEEFKEDGIAVNALWPRTAIYTAAMDMLGGSGVKEQCRRPEIMSDAAYAIFTQDSKTCTGNFFIDEDVLKQAGQTDFDKYLFAPGGTLLPDFFLDEYDPEQLVKQMEEQGGTPKFKKSSPSTGPAATFSHIKSVINEEVVGMVGGVIAFDLKEDGPWFLDLKNGAGAVGEGAAPGEADCTMTMDTESFNQMFSGKLNPTQAFMSGKLKIKGNIQIAMKLEKLMKKLKQASSVADAPAASAPAAAGPGPEATFDVLRKILDEDLVKSIGGVFTFDLKDGEKWYLDLKNGSGAAGKGNPPTGDADCTMGMDTESFVKMFDGKLNPTQAFMAGKLKIKGNLPLAMKLEKLMKTMQKSKL